MKSIYFCLFSSLLFLCYINSESTNSKTLSWNSTIRYVLKDELTPEAETTINQTISKIQNRTCLNFTQIPEPSMSTNMRDFPARYGLEFGSDRTVDESDDDDFCNSTEFGGSNDHPYTLIDVTQYYEKNESAIESCIYKALGISKNQNITCEENKVQITINEQKN